MNVYRLRVALREGRAARSTWRVIEIKGSQTLHTLHRAIVDAFDRFDDHLYSFFMTADRQDVSQEYVSPGFFEDDEAPGEELPHDATHARMGKLGLAVGKKFDYLFDYGEAWEHIIEVLAIVDGVQSVRYPRIVESHGDSPEQYPPVDEVEQWEPDVPDEERGKVLPFPPAD